MLDQPLELRCGLTLKNRMVKAAMSDGLGDGRGGVTDAQCALYERWADGGAALAIIGEVQTHRGYPESPANLVVDALADTEGLARLAAAGHRSGALLWPQLGHAGALAHESIADRAGPSALDLDELTCRGLTVAEVEALPAIFAAGAVVCAEAGFSGVEIHAGHGFLLSQFLSPLFNHRTDRYGGSIEARASIIIEIVHRVRAACGPEFGVGVKLNSTDKLDGGLVEDDAIVVVDMLDAASIDIIDVSGGTYFPGAASSSDRRTHGAYFSDFGRRARARTSAAVMVTGGVKTQAEAVALIDDGAADLVGLARTLVLDPALPRRWAAGGGDPVFPTFESTVPGGVTAWYTMRLADLGAGRGNVVGGGSVVGGGKVVDRTPAQALAAFERHSRELEPRWRARAT